MKKLLIASVSVLALSAGAALAQTANNSTITQGGYSLDSNNNWVGNGDDSVGSVANVTQINGGYGILTSVVQQNDSNQIASVNQTGHGYSTLTSNIVQGGGNGNKAYVTQTDSLGNSTQSSYITQSGTNGYANVNQSGPNDSSTVTQTGNYSDGTWNYNGVWTGVTVTQTGSAQNNSTVSQSSDSSGVAVWQGGSGGTNNSTVTQNPGSSSTAYNFAAVSQTGSGSLTNTSFVTQTGGGNWAGVTQR